MSLINEALKKAQRQHGDAPLSPDCPHSDESSTRVVRRAKPLGFDSFIARLGLCALVLILIVGGGVYVSHRLSNSAPTPTSAQVAATDSIATNAPAPPPLAPAADAIIEIPSTAEPEANTQPVVTAPVEPSTPEPVKSSAPLRMDTRAIAFIESARISGIRASSTESKVLMNDRVYRVGDTVEHELEVKLVSIAANALTFEDIAGARYTRNF
jgi:hypothetical protein